MRVCLCILGLACTQFLAVACDVARIATEPDTIMANESEDVAAIRQLAVDWHDGWEAGDADALLDLYGDEPVLMPQGQPAVHGREAIRSLYEAVFREYTVEGNGDLLDVEAAGDLGYYWSTYRLTATPKAGGELLEDEGKSLFILRRRADGAWKIARLIANSDRPPAASE